MTTRFTTGIIGPVLNGTDTAKEYMDHTHDWRKCTKCSIGKHAYNHVFARGNIPCKVLFIGEAPGKSEDTMGLPFVGVSGKLLDKWIAATGKVFSYAITNTVLCRPTDRIGGDNRPPTQKEMANCRPRLIDFIALADPKGIVLLGAVARDNVSSFIPSGIKVLKLPHPAYVLRCGGFEGSLSGSVVARLSTFVRGL